MIAAVRSFMSNPDLRKVFGKVVEILLKPSLLLRIAAWALGGLMMVMMHPALADEPAELGDIRIEAGTATPAEKGGRSRVRFRIINNSRTGLHLTGISTPVAKNAELVARVGSRETSVLQSIGILSEETLDLTTSHLHYVLHPLREALHSGDEFSITLHFTGWSRSTSIHVH